MQPAFFFPSKSLCWRDGEPLGPYHGSHSFNLACFLRQAGQRACPGGVTVGEAKALDEAAEMIEGQTTVGRHFTEEREERIESAGRCADAHHGEPRFGGFAIRGFGSLGRGGLASWRRSRYRRRVAPELRPTRHQLRG